MVEISKKKMSQYHTQSIKKLSIKGKKNIKSFSTHLNYVFNPVKILQSAKGLYFCVSKYHLVPKVLTGCQSFGSEFWQGKNELKVSAQNFVNFVCTFVTILFSCWGGGTWNFLWLSWSKSITAFSLRHSHMSFLTDKHELCRKSSTLSSGSNFHPSIASTWLTKFYVLILCVIWICCHCTSA